MANLRDSRAFKISPKTLSRTNVDGSVAIMLADNDEFYFNLDGLAAETWNLLDGNRSIADVAKNLARRHKFDEPKLREDVAGLMKDLLDEDLIVER